METPYRDLKLDQVRELIGDGYEIVDVRENSEWERGHLAGAVTGLFDYLSWGGWYTSLAFGLPAALGLLVSARTFFQGRSTEANPSSA